MIASTIIGIFYLEKKVQEALLKTLKSKLACGGAIEEEYVMLQGDQRTKVKELLLNLGWKFK